MGFTHPGGATQRLLHHDPVTAEHAPAPWRRGARTEGEVRERLNGRSARRWLVWPAAAVALFGLGGLGALNLTLSDQLQEAFVLWMALAGYAGAATTFLVTRILAAQRLALIRPCVLVGKHDRYVRQPAHQRRPGV